MYSKICKLITVILLSLFIFHGGCKTPFTPSEELPIIWVNASSISFTCAEAGPNPDSQVLEIRNSGANSLNYTITDDADFYDVDWLTVTPDKGSSSGKIVQHTILVDKIGMGARDQTYNAKITISSPDAANSPQTVDISLEIKTEHPPEIKVTPKSLDFKASEGVISNPANQTIRIKNKGQLTMNYTITDDANWMDVSPSEGTSSGRENTHQVSVSASGLSAGAYQGTITITDPNASNNPQIVNVILQISPPLANNEIAVTLDKSSGGDGTLVLVSFEILGNINEISSFSLDLTYDEKMFDYVGFDTTGTLTQGWGSGIGANKASAGLVKVGGFGGTKGITPGSSGTLIYIKLRVNCKQCGSTSQICIQNLDDDIKGMIMNPGCMTFSYQ